MNKNVIIGVAGHVDHGKTSFVLLPDRYRHRQASGRKAARLVIGLRHCLLEKPDGSAAAFVDVPGHSNFLKNTVRGLHCIDAVVLVIAADDGVMPQTREHLEILNFFNVRDGMIVLSND